MPVPQEVMVNEILFRPIGDPEVVAATDRLGDFPYYNGELGDDVELRPALDAKLAGYKESGLADAVDDFRTNTGRRNLVIAGTIGAFEPIFEANIPDHHEALRDAAPSVFGGLGWITVRLPATKAGVVVAR